MSTIAKIAAGTVLGAVVALAPTTAAHAGIYTWKFSGSYATNSDCVSAGQAEVDSGDADAYRCSGTTGTELYLGYIW